jgi:hypothetical protein
MVRVPSSQWMASWVSLTSMVTVLPAWIRPRAIF